MLLSHQSFRENQAIGSFVARMTAVDPDQERNHTFELVNGEGSDGNAAFTIDGNLLRTATLIDSEERSSYSIRIRATDWGEETVEKTFVLTVEPSPPDQPGPGDLDLSFNPPAMEGGGVLAVVQQDDGKILIGGTFTSIGGQPLARIARLNAGGTLDTDFAQSLSGAVGPGFGNFRVQAIVVQPDRKILIGGVFQTVHGVARFQIARLHEDGSLDTGFNAAAAGPVKSIALQEDGRIVIGGSFTSVMGTPRNYVARLLPDGSVDSSFGNGLPGPNAPVETVAIDADGRILIGGAFTWVNGSARNRIARLHADGALDPTFGGERTGADGTVSAITSQNDGKMLISGNFHSVNDVDRRGIARLNEDGTLDSDFTPEQLGNVSAVALQRDGRVLVGESLLRLNPNGSRDATFSKNPTHFVRSLALGDDGKILAGTNSGIVRIHGGNQPPTDLTLSPAAIAELQSPGTTVGFLSVLDDPVFGTSAEHAFVLVPGGGDDGNDAFGIDGDRLETAAEFDTQEQDAYAIRIRAANAKGLWVKGTFIVSVIPDHYARWAADLPEGQRAPTADPGGHGIPNLLRYAFGMGASQPDRGNLPQTGTASVTADGQHQTYLTLTYTRQIGDSGLNLIAEVSDDLLSWLPFEGAEEIIENTTDETETVILTDSKPVADQTKRFLRVRVEREPAP